MQHTRTKIGQPYNHGPMSSKRERFMFELVYPGVLGAGLVGLALRMTRDHSFAEGARDESVPLGIALMVFFSSSFLNVGEKYPVPAFFLDIVEVCLMFLAFHWLKLFDPEKEQLWAVGVYAVLAAVLALQWGWRALAGAKPWHRLWGMRAAAIAVLIIGGFLHCYLPESAALVSLTVSAVLIVLTLIYDVFRESQSAS